MAVLFKGMQELTQDLEQDEIEFCENGRSRCSHLCVNTGHNYECTCPSYTGLVLGTDSSTCVMPTEFLIFTSLDEGTINMIPTMIPDGIGGEAYLMDSMEFTNPSVLAHSSSPSAVAYDPLEQRVYWSDVEESRIYRQFLNGTKTEIFLEGGVGTVDGMAIDPGWFSKTILPFDWLIWQKFILKTILSEPTFIFHEYYSDV